MKNSKLQYRVIWQRVDGVQLIKNYATLKGAERRYGVLTGDEAHCFAEHDPDERVCCSGHECGCGGETYRQRHERLNRELSPLKYIRLESRPIGNWKPVKNQEAAA